MLLTIQLCWLRILTPFKYMQGMLRSGYAEMNPFYTQMGWSTKFGKILFTGLVLFIAYGMLSLGVDLMVHAIDKTHASSLLLIIKSLGTKLPLDNPWVLALGALIGLCICVWLIRLYVRFFRLSIRHNPESFHGVLSSHQEHIDVLKEKRRLQASLPVARGKPHTPRL